MSSEETKAPAAASEDKKEAETGANKVTDVAVNDANNVSSNVAADDVEIVGVVKPRHLRTPVIVSLSSDEEDNVKKVIKTEEQVSDAF